jgi:hypothetical protein
MHAGSAPVQQSVVEARAGRMPSAVSERPLPAEDGACTCPLSSASSDAASVILDAPEGPDAVRMEVAKVTTSYTDVLTGAPGCTASARGTTRALPATRCRRARPVQALAHMMLPTLLDVQLSLLELMRTTVVLKAARWTCGPVATTPSEAHLQPAQMKFVSRNACARMQACSGRRRRQS